MGKGTPAKPSSEAEFNWHPVGTGPFIIAEYEQAHRVRLVRNPDYRTTVAFPTDGFPPETGGMAETIRRPKAAAD